MFDLDQAVARWRQQLAADGLADAPSLDELESHLREDFEARVGSGLEAACAFDLAAESLGRAESLTSEFSKIETIDQRLRDMVRTLAGVPLVSTHPSMNPTPPSTEPAWVTYLRAATFLAPALLLWAFAVLMVFPKIQQICQYAGVNVPSFFGVFLVLSQYALLFGVGLTVVFGLLEKRSEIWPRYRRAVIGIGVFVLNTAALALITAMMVLCAIAAPALMNHAR